MRYAEEYFGQTREGEPIHRYNLSNSNGVSVSLISFGAIVQSVKTPCREGVAGEISLGFDRLDDYLEEHPYFGATVGRYANRIAGGKFSMGEESYTLAVNNGPNHLHGGLQGFDKVAWAGERLGSGEEAGVRFLYTSQDGEEGYPGELKVSVSYILDEGNRLLITYEAATNASTPVNLTNHTYWNLAGAGSGDILGHELSIVSDRYLPVDEDLIPNGDLASVEGGPMDFRNLVEIGSRFDSLPGGYDHCYVLGEKPVESPRPAAILRDPSTGRCMRISTTEPGVQFYTGNFLDGIKGSGGKVFDRHGALCLETQKFPDSPNQPGFPSSILDPGEVYRHVTMHEFSVT